MDPGSSCYDNTLTISVAPSAESPPVKAGTGEQPIADENRYHILGPGIATSIKREQKFNIGQSSTESGASKNSPSSSEQDQKEIQLPPSGAFQPATADTTAVSGTMGNANPQSPSESRTIPAGSPETAKRRANTGKILSTEVTFSVPMLPNFMGVKPRDFILIPSLKGLGDYIEDWEVSSVQYTQEPSGQIMMAIKGTRPFIGDETIVNEATLESARSKISNLTTPELWGQYYWQPKQS